MSTRETTRLGVAEAVAVYSRKGSADPVAHERLYGDVLAQFGPAVARYFDEAGELPYMTTTAFPLPLPLPWPMRYTRAVLFELWRLIVSVGAGFAAAVWAQAPVPAVLAVVIVVVVAVAVSAAFTLVPRKLCPPRNLDQRQDQVRRYRAIARDHEQQAAADAAAQRAERTEGAGS